MKTMYKQGLWALFLGSSILLSGCNANNTSQSTSDSNIEAEQLSEEQIQAAIAVRKEQIKTDCRTKGGKSCEVMALEALSDYEQNGDFSDLKSGIFLASKACNSDKRYCLVKGDLFLRAYQDGLNIETWLPGRYIRDELIAAYTLATQSGDIAIAGDAYYKLGLVNSQFKRPALAQKNFALGCKIGGATNCINGAEQLSKLGKSDSALDAYQKACDFNNSSACLRLGDRFYEQKRYSDGNKAYEKACDLKEGSACLTLAQNYSKAGKHQAAAVAYERSCTLGNETSCSVLARSKVRSGSLEEAFALFSKACDLGNGKACLFLGNFQIFKGQYEQAQGQLQRACDHGYSEACYQLGIMPGLSSQSALVSACNFDRPLACSGVIASYSSVDANAYSAYNKSCDAGNKDSCLSLAFSAQRQQKLDEAAQSYQKACKLGSGLGCDSAALLDLKHGRFDSAINNSIKACSLKSGTACMNVAFAYSQGVGVKRNATKAQEFYAKACKLGLDDACFIKN